MNRRAKRERPGNPNSWTLHREEVTCTMELLKDIPGVSIRKHDVSPLPQVRPTNVTELNVLYPFAQQKNGAVYHPSGNSRHVYSANGTYLQLNRDAFVRGTSLVSSKTDPKSILKRPSITDGSSIGIFLDSNAAKSTSSNKKKVYKTSTQKTSSEGVHASRRATKTPSKIVTFNLDNEYDARKAADAQWSVGIARVAKPLRERKQGLEVLGPEYANRGLSSQQNRKRYYLPLLLKRNANGKHVVVPSTCQPSSRTTTKVPSTDDKTVERFRAMADKYRKALQDSNLGKRGQQGARISV